MKILRNIWDDLRQGDNIDLYATIILALVVSVLNLLGITPATWISTLTLAVLALLAITNLVNRHKLNEAIQKQSFTHIFIDAEEYPPSVSDDINKAKELWLVGFHLTKTISKRIPILEDKLSKNEHVKIILINPRSNAAQYAFETLISSNTLDQFMQKIEITLASLSELARKYPKIMEVRLIDHPIYFGACAMDIESPKGILYIEHYSYKFQGNDPRFILQYKDGYPYDLYCKQLKALWQYAKPYEFPKANIKTQAIRGKRSQKSPRKR